MRPAGPAGRWRCAGWERGQSTWSLNCACRADEVLRRAVSFYGARNWKKIGEPAGSCTWVVP